MERLMEILLLLNDGEYTVNTSKGKYIVKVSRKEELLQSRTPSVSKKVIIERENKTLFGEYEHKIGYDTYGRDSYPFNIDTHLYFYPENTTFKHGFEFRGYNEILIYDNEEKTKKYYVTKKQILYNDEDNNTRNYKIKDNILLKMGNHQFLLGLDLNNFDKIININNKTIRIGKDKEILKELKIIEKEFMNINKLVNDNIDGSKYLKDILDIDNFKFKFANDNINIEDFKDMEKELFHVYKIYLEAKKLFYYTCDASILKEILYELNSEFNKIYKTDLTFISKSNNNKKEMSLVNKLNQLKCGIYYINIPNDLIEIYVQKDGKIDIRNKEGKKIIGITEYYQVGNEFDKIFNYVNKEVEKILNIQRKEDEKDKTKQKEERIKQLKKELRLLENDTTN